ncbi:hypothetical protein GCM10010387_63510 [Streptomyces inusitatus]|uniref:Uncharacterized protein n=1 Tax=Streptomyces inusitatus TaxID=68221 RepID=A0A918V292_9ACTN|nr:hypothetical protein [Streptomyces inusitatus]GGZ61133.1 hypothetical protein GCM10010387_63510 [Streptomyces inusitatus]
MLGVLITGGDTAAPGTALLIAAAPVGKGRLVDASSVLPALAAVPPSVLTGTSAATVIELADPLDPQTVLTRIRSAAAAPGPLFLYVAGQLQLDRKQRLPHLALARSTPSTLRYTGLPWHWLASELTIRRPGTTTVFVDLVADAEAWRRVGEEGLGLGLSIRLYGRVAPPASRREEPGPAYLRACAAIWRAGSRPDLDTLHEQAAIQAGMSGALLLSGTPALPASTGAAGRDAPPAMTPPPAVRAPAGSRPPAPVPAGAGGGGQALASSGPPQGSPEPARAAIPVGDGDPHPAILAAAQAGRHSEAAAAAAAWEQQEMRAHGPGSVQAIHWLEVRADLARLAREPRLSCELWMTAADARLTREQAGDDPDVEAAVDRAHHQWEQIEDAAEARALAPRLVTLRRRVPGRQRGALRVLQRRLESLHSARPV